MDLYHSIGKAHEAVLSGKTTCQQLVTHFLEQAISKAHLQAFLELYEDEALAQSAKVDQKIADGTAGKLAGAVIALKDNICYKDHKLSAASKILEGFTSLYSATVVERLLAEDAIILGRTNCDEFAMGASTENSAYFPTLNADDENSVPGGSSGGSAVAVQAGLCHAALGSDTGGSVRQPAAFCHVVGMRPTYGHVSRWGLIAYASSFDQIGPLTQHPDDAHLLMQIIGGHDAQDATSSTHGIDYSVTADDEPKKIAFLRNCIDHEGVDAEVKKALYAEAEKLAAEGHEIEWVDFPYIDYVVPNYYLLTTAEASSNLSRYAGMLYGHRSEKAHDIASTIVDSRSEGFGEEVQRRIMLGTFVLSAGYYDAYYTKAQKVRRIIANYTDELLAKHDYIMLPTAPHTAFARGAVADPITMYLEDIFCVHAALAGIPAISIPLKRHSNGKGIGLQIMGRKWQDQHLLDFAGKVQDASAT